MNEHKTLGWFPKLLLRVSGSYGTGNEDLRIHVPACGMDGASDSAALNAQICELLAIHDLHKKSDMARMAQSEKSRQS